MSRMARAILRAYPPSFSARYGAELAALIDDLPPSARATLDLARGAARAWISPRFAGPDAHRLRLQASVCTTWLAWIAGFLIAPVMNKALLDPPAPRVSGLVRALLYAGSATLLVGWVLVVIGIASIAIRGWLPGLRSRPGALIRPLIPAIVLALLLVIGLLTIATLGTPVRLNGATQAAFALWFCVLVGFLVCAGVGPGMSLRRLEMSAPALRLPARLAGGAALALAAMCGCSLVAATVAGDPTLFNSRVPVVVALVIACTSATVALVSSRRGIRALRPVR